MKTLYVTPGENHKKWFIIDAENRPLGRVAMKAACLLRGKHKAHYVPYHDLGDQVIIINAAKAALSGNKSEDKFYYEHSGFPGGLKVMNYKKLLARRPLAPIEKAVKGMLPKGPLGRDIFRNLRVYADNRHPHAGQDPTPVEVK
ncbi:50S ribosomal protein L13 [Candidatus Haliotispira prima]|uniref:Large ribosomal subunit protein uL13 n=1 Tax=Candidatus Haliotispira prima TaxID=3034016 RepID=A0ABY8MF03_9SPIO|nr:50S ribosomal protein L13 [Candidatus Haliotispira prima]